MPTTVEVHIITLSNNSLNWVLFCVCFIFYYHEINDGTGTLKTISEFLNFREPGRDKARSMIETQRQEAYSVIICFSESIVENLWASSFSAGFLLLATFNPNPHFHGPWFLHYSSSVPLALRLWWLIPWIFKHVFILSISKYLSQYQSTLSCPSIY